MKMCRIHTCMLLPLIMLLVMGCEFRPLQDPSNMSYVRVYVNEDILNVTTGFYDDYVKTTRGLSNPSFTRPQYESPDIIRLCVYDAGTGELAAERYLRHQGDDAQGHYWDGYVALNSGRYSLVAYNFGTTSTIVEGERQEAELHAYTHEVSSSVSTRLKAETSSDVPIRYDADHLFVAGGEDYTLTRYADGEAVQTLIPGGDRIEVSEHQGVDTLRNSAGEPWFRAESVVKTYYIQIGVIGSQWVSSAMCVLDGMVEGTPLETRRIDEAGETALYFDMAQGSYPDGYRDGVSDYHCIWGTFGTFGKLPDTTSNLTVTFEFITTYGKRYTVPLDITYEFRKADALEHQWLLIDKVITIPEPDPGTNPSDGGMAPSVGEWGEIHTEFEI